METLAYLAPLLPAWVMAVTDWRERSIGVVWLVVFSLLTVLSARMAFGWGGVLENVGFGMVVCLLLGGVLWTWSRWQGIPLSRAIGVGDVLFVLSFTPEFAPLSFVRFLTLSLLTILILWFILGRRFHLRTVPLVSGLVLCLTCKLLIDKIL